MYFLASESPKPLIILQQQSKSASNRQSFERYQSPIISSTANFTEKPIKKNSKYDSRGQDNNIQELLQDFGKDKRQNRTDGWATNEADILHIFQDSQIGASTTAPST